MFIVLVNKINGQEVDIHLKKIQVFKNNKVKNKISTWDFHKPNIITDVTIDNKSSDTLKFTFNPINCILFFSLRNKWEKEFLNFAYNDSIENEIILPQSRKKVSLLWRIEPKLILSTSNLKKKMSKSYITMNFQSHKLISSKTKNVTVKHSD
jgi:hypothetical protein